MKEFIAKVFARWERTYGDAALEFAAALATGSLKLTPEDTQALGNRYRNSQIPRKWMKYLEV
ncbi:MULTISPECIES: hypothetical protein [Pseudomonas aeruginosa group]|uniref:hypothetical protein n=1 Tax=Pseudomonas aeruginosa group TaxID=136841 RepID=UPI001F380957|nr:MULTISPECIES: hypothetical protein [Pseudomonas aeruginosa group]MCW8021438.1 hypothetical protein [Pseudomonas aeruginosa]